MNQATPLRITVIGTGYLGATHAVCMADLGHEVIGLDADEAKVASLNDGVVPFFEPGLEELLRKNLETGRLRFTTSFEEVGAFGDVHFLCVGTPQKKNENAADLTMLGGAYRSLVPLVQPGALVVGKSTVPVGTAERFADELVRTQPDAELAWNPEFLREGFAIQDTLAPDRLVFGVRSGTAEARLREVYAPLLELPTPVVVTDLATAQLVKVAANAFLATKISFINAMAELCEATGGDVTELAKALSYDSRIGGRFLNAGLGFGGGCLPKDIRGFMARAGELGVDQALTFLREIDAINLRRRTRMVELTREVLGGSLHGARIAVLGAAFKPDSDDIRDSPALDVASSLLQRGAEVTVYDPHAMDNARRQFPDLAYAEHAVAACTGADIVLHLTEWAEFRAIAPDALAAAVAHRRLLDGRNVLDPQLWRDAGWTFRALGRP